MKRLAVLTALAVGAVVVTYQRGYAAPLLFGGGAWADAFFGYRPNDEPDVIA